jgi:hypothetical protein
VFKKFFGKKNDGFFLQLEDDSAQKPAEKAKTPAKPEAVAPATPAPATKETAPVATKTEAAAAPATPKAAKSEKKSVKKAETPKAVVEPKAPVVTAPPAPPVTNFATDYLMKPSSNSSRRLPGANMRGFLDLARKVDKPTAFKATASERKAGEK